MPGTASSIAITFDGHLMAKRGQAMKALGLAIVFSALGSIFSLGIPKNPELLTKVQYWRIFFGDAGN